MNEDAIRQIIREEIQSVLSESALSDLVDYNTFKTELARALRRVGAAPKVVLAAQRDRDHVVEQAYDELKDEIGQLGPDEEFSGVPDIVGWTCKEVVHLLGGTPQDAEDVAIIMTGGTPEHDVD